MSNPASLHSTAREHIAEHALLAALGQHIWATRVRAGGEPMGVLRAEADNDGFDVLLSLEGVHRAVQLKVVAHDSSTSGQKLNRKLTRAPGGCAIVMVVGDDLSLQRFLFLGSENPNEAVQLHGFRTARHTKANSEGYKAKRPGIVIVNHGDFRRVETIQELTAILFGG